MPMETTALIRSSLFETARWVAIVALCAGLGCGKKRNEPEREAPSPTTAKEQTHPSETGRIRVAVDERVELFSILFRLAESPEYQSQSSTPYSKAVSDHFGAFRNHAAVVATRKLRESYGISFNAPVSLAVYLDSPTSLTPVRSLSPAPTSLDARWKQVDLTEYLATVRAFVADTGFAEFMAAHRDYFRAVEQRFQQTLDLAAVAAWFDGFFGARPKLSAVVVPGLLTGQNNYGATAELGDGTTVLYQVVGVVAVDDGGLPRIDDMTEQLMIHEMAHGYINPLFEAHQAMLEKPGLELFARVDKVMSAQAYTSWETMLNETGVRAATALCLLDVRGEAAASRTLGIDERNSFLWIAGLTDVFREHRERHKGDPSLETLVADTATYLRAWLDAHPESLPEARFRGPINAALGAAPDKAVYVTPGKSDATSALARYVRGIRDQFAAKARLVGADDIDEAARRAPTMVVYGTPPENAVVKALVDKFGWRVEASGIHLGDREFPGDDLLLVACHPNPDDPARAVVLYTAAKDAALAAPNGVFHGPTDWVVARHLGGDRYAIVAKGDFPKDLAGNWKPLPADEPKPDP